MSTFAYTHPEGRGLHVPEQKFTALAADQRCVPLRGNVYTMAVMVGTRCVGWIDCTSLNYATVADWMLAQEDGT
jgi:hypothetical protein